MKYLNKAMMCVFLALTLTLGAMALAESAEVPTLEAVPEQAEAPAGDAAATDDSAALQDAMNAYRSAKRESRQADRRAALEEELKGYVESGKLTQAQADLILSDYEARAQQRANAGNDPSSRGGRGGRKGGMGDNDRSGCNGNMGGSGSNDRSGRNGGMGGSMNGGRGGKGGRMGGSATPQGLETAPEMVQPDMPLEGV